MAGRSGGSSSSARFYGPPQPYRRRGKGRNRQQNGGHNRGSREGSDDDEETISRQQQEKYKDLLVFGYASRIFRDDEKAKQMEKNLIPWCGDRSNMIDRYDCRGHLHNLTEFDASTAASWVAPQPDEEDMKLEQLCQQERYRDLLKIQREKRRVQAEERQKVMESEYLQAIASPKRESPNHDDGVHAAIPFSYDAVPPPADPVGKVENKTEGITQGSVAVAESIQKKDKKEFEPFTPRPDFDVPSHICLPQYKRLNSIIERTARFVAEKGSQLEVVIRAKQAGNASFSFLQPSDVLHPYYRFLVDAIKKGTFKPPAESSSSSSESDSDSEDGHYLHPSLMRSAAAGPPPPPPAPPVNPKFAIFNEPSAFSTVYGTLINKVQSVTGHSTSAPGAGGRPSADMLSAMEKMAAYVVKNGPQFEAMIQARHAQDDPKFGFIHGYHPYHSLYDEMKRNLREKAMEEKLAEEEPERVQLGGYHAVAPPAPGDVLRLPTPPPPPPPPPPEPPQEDPRIAELKRKALEASLKVVEKLKERQSTTESAKSPSLPPPIIFTVKSVTKERESSATDLDELLEESLTRESVKDRSHTSSMDAPPTGSLLELLKADEIRLLKAKVRERKKERKDVDNEDDELIRKISKKKRRHSSTEDDDRKSRSKKNKKKRSRSRSRERSKHRRKHRSRSRC